MPRRVRRVRKNRARKSKGNRRSRVPKHLSPSIRQSCRLVETISVQDINANTPFQYTFTLNDFNRARYESVNWQFFKASRVTWTYEPLYNTFQDGTSAQSAPFIYTRMNRTQDSIVPASLGDLQGAGAMPRKLINTYKLSYKPNWCIQGLTASSTNAGNVNGLYSLGARTEYGWLNNSSHSFTQAPSGSAPSTRNASVLVPFQNGATTSILNAQTTHQIPSYCTYNGHDTYIDQKYSAADNQPIARVTCTVEWLFKGPVYNDYIGVTNAAPSVSAPA